MDLRLQPFNFEQAVARAGLTTSGEPINRAGTTGAASATGKTIAADKAGAASFQTAMSQALRAASDAQLDSEGQARELQLGNPTVSLEQTMVASVKSQLAFQSVLAVRNRMVQAYTEIMNMQV